MSRVWSDATVNAKVLISAEERMRITLEVLENIYRVNRVWENDEIVEYESHYHGSGEYRNVIGKVTPTHRAALMIYTDLKNENR